MGGDQDDQQWLVRRDPARARSRSPHVRRTKDSALKEVLMIARNLLADSRRPSGTTALRQPATRRRQLQHLRSSAPRQSPPKTVCNSPVVPSEAGLGVAHSGPNLVRIHSSQPPLAEVLRRPVESAQYL